GDVARVQQRDQRVEIDARTARRVDDVGPLRQEGHPLGAEDVSRFGRQWAVETDEVRLRQQLFEVMAALDAESLFVAGWLIGIVEDDAQAQRPGSQGRRRADASA